MKKDNIQAFFKGKSFYLSLLIGVCAIFAVAVVYISLRSNDNGNNLVDLNEPMDIAEQSEIQSTDGGDMNEESNILDIADNAQLNNDSLLENDVVSEHELLEDSRAAMYNSAEKLEDKTADVSEEAAVSVSNSENVTASSLKFNEEEGLLWPINGNVIKNYSMDKVVYFETLNQYKCNPAILISGEVNQEVVSAADGIITDIYENDETGTTMVMSIGNGYSLEYGQLQNLKAKVGDKIDEGTMIAYIAEPTNYYVVEGSNLYFKVSQNDETVNPLLLLR